MKKIIATVIVIMICLSCLAACSSNQEPLQPRVAQTQSPESASESKPEPAPESAPEPIKDAALNGFYTLIKYDAGGVDLLGIAEDSGESTLFIYIEFRDDGTAFYFFMDEGDDITYKVSGNQVTLIFDVDGDDNELEGVIEGDTITFEQDGLVMVYKLNTDFQPGELSADIIPPGFYTLLEVKTEDGEDLMPNVVSWEEETGISVMDACHIKILEGNRYEQCAMQFKEDYVLACGAIYLEGDTIIFHEQWEEYDDDFFEAELNGDILIRYVDDVLWIFQRNDDYNGRE